MNKAGLIIVAAVMVQVCQSGHADPTSVVPTVQELKQCTAHFQAFEGIAETSPEVLKRQGDCMALLNPLVNSGKKLSESIWWQVDTRIDETWENVALHESLVSAQFELMMQEAFGWQTRLVKKVITHPCNDSEGD